MTDKFRRFGETLELLDEAFDHMHEEGENLGEISARSDLIQLCVEIAAKHGHETTAPATKGVENEG